MNLYRIACVVTSLLYIFLFFSLQFEPEKLCLDLGLKGSDTAFIIIKRASILMLGFGVLLGLAGNIVDKRAKFAISTSVSICMLGLAFMSAYEFSRGNVSNGIIFPMAIESIVGILFLVLALINRKSLIT